MERKTIHIAVGNDFYLGIPICARVWRNGTPYDERVKFADLDNVQVLVNGDYYQAEESGEGDACVHIPAGLSVGMYSVEMVATYNGQRLAIKQHNAFSIDEWAESEVVSTLGSPYLLEGSVYVFAPLVGGGGVTVDSEISATSFNPVENRAIAKALDDKADKSDTYTKGEVDALVAAVEPQGYATEEELQSEAQVRALADNALQDAVNSKAAASDLQALSAVVERKADNSAVAELSGVVGQISASLQGKADKTDTYTKEEVNDLIASVEPQGYATSEELQAESSAREQADNALQSSLDGKAAKVHTHAIADVNGLQTALDGKQAAGDYATSASVAAEQGAREQADTELQTAIAAKADNSAVEDLAAEVAEKIGLADVPKAFNGRVKINREGNLQLLYGENEEGKKPAMLSVGTDNAQLKTADGVVICDIDNEKLEIKRGDYAVQFADDSFSFKVDKQRRIVFKDGLLEIRTKDAGGGVSIVKELADFVRFGDEQVNVHIQGQENELVLDEEGVKLSGRRGQVLHATEDESKLQWNDESGNSQGVHVNKQGAEIRRKVINGNTTWYTDFRVRKDNGGVEEGVHTYDEVGDIEIEAVPSDVREAIRKKSGITFQWRLVGNNRDVFDDYGEGGVLYADENYTERVAQVLVSRYFSGMFFGVNVESRDYFNVRGTLQAGTYYYRRERFASGYNSHAEGCETTASGYNSHAEGENTTASGEDSHAEGCETTASGEDSHAEGYDTTASGDYSHAEGYDTTASGEDSHAEGVNTTASGEDSHAQNRGTIAGSLSQTAIGEYNVADDEENDNRGEYVFIIGNGTNNDNRHNAFAVKWDGTIVIWNGSESVELSFDDIVNLKDNAGI